MDNMKTNNHSQVFRLLVYAVLAPIFLKKNDDKEDVQKRTTLHTLLRKDELSVDRDVHKHGDFSLSSHGHAGTHHSRLVLIQTSRSTPP